MKTLSLKLNKNTFADAEEVTSELKIPRNRLYFLFKPVKWFWQA